MTPLDLLVIYGSVRHDRQGIKAARFIVGECLARGHRTTLVDPAEDRLPLLDRMFKEYEPGGGSRGPVEAGGSDQGGRWLHHRLGGIQPQRPAGALQPARPLPRRIFLAAIGHRLLFRRAVRGGEGRDAVAGHALRAGTPSIPSLLPVPSVQDAFDDQGHPKDDAWHGRAGKFLGELEWYANALKAARQGGVPS